LTAKGAESELDDGRIILNWRFRFEEWLKENQLDDEYFSLADMRWYAEQSFKRAWELASSSHQADPADGDEPWPKQELTPEEYIRRGLTRR